jgi:NADPH-dependent 2,4-dienoyl-CoA reductase/sulfur reductase-like enzyme/rhodanese-related sulfurtransferase
VWTTLRSARPYIYVEENTMPSRTPRLLIVGGVAGGASCAARARRLSEECEIVMFDRGPYVSFANCGLPYYVGDVITAEEQLLIATPRLFAERLNITVHTDTEVLSINRATHDIEVCDLRTGQRRHEPYDALVLATGAQAMRPPLPGIDLPGIYVMRTIPDSQKIRQAVAQATRAVIVGGGFIGLEMAENLVRRGLEVTMVEMTPQVLPPLDAEMAAFVATHLRTRGVQLHLGATVEAFEPRPEGGVRVRTSGGEALEADLVILGIGVRPDAALASAAGLTLGERGGIRVDDRMQTSDPAIWAVGDVVEVHDVVTDRWQVLPLAGPANRQGRIAAAAIVEALYPGAGSSRPSQRFRGVQGTAVCGVFGLTVAMTGASEKALQRVGRRDYAMIYLHPGSHAGYYPGAKPIHMKVLFATADGRLLGAQAVGEEGVARRMDVMATALQLGGTVYDLEEAELCYAPQFGAAKDPINLAGMIAANHLRGTLPLASWDALATTQAHVVDVRSAAEFAAHHIPGAINIPLDELRGRLGELAGDREIWVVCGVGQRAYYATRILMHHGFRVCNLSGGMQTYAGWSNPAARP